MDNNVAKSRQIFERSECSATPSAPEMDAHVHQSHETMTFLHPPPSYNSLHQDEEVVINSNNFIKFLWFISSILSALFSCIILGLGIWCHLEVPTYNPYYYLIWVPTIFLISGLNGILAITLGSRKFGHKLYISHLVLSTTSLLICIISCFITLHAFHLISTDRSAYCIIKHAYDVHHIQRIAKSYNFQTCQFQIMLGIGVNGVQFIMVIIIGILNLITFIFGLLRACNNSFSKYFH